MGIKGLLQYLSGAQRDVHIGSFKGQTAAIDAYCWLHKGAYSCALQLVMKTEKCEKLPFIRYCMKRINLLRHHDITPIVVFDGARLPMKSKTEEERKERRKSYLEKGKALMKEGKQSEAVDCFQRCVDVSPEMALAFIKVLRQEGVQVIVAPYEADAELAYLVKENIAHFVITEDSDLLVFGCPQVLFKMNDAGYGKLIELKDIGKANKSLIGFTPDSFRHMCILCGCDYLASIPGIGPSTACKLMRKFNKDPYRAIKSIKYESGKVPENYEEEFRRADHTFLYQLVFDPRTQQQVRLTTPPPDIDPQELQHAGFLNSPSKQIGLARGNINPLTMETMDTYSPAKHQDTAGKKSMKSKNWSGSVLSKGPLTISRQTSLSIPVSDRAKKDFRPPKRSKLDNDDDDLISSEELRLLYSNSTMETMPSLPTLSAVTETVVGRNKFAIVSSEDTVVRSKYFIQNTSSEPEEQMSQSYGSGPSGLAALDQIEEPSSSLDSGLGDSLPQDASLSVKRKLFDLYSDSDNKRVKLNDETGLGDWFKSELLDQSNQHGDPNQLHDQLEDQSNLLEDQSNPLDDQLKDLSSQPDDQPNQPNQLENLSNQLEDQSSQSTSFEIVDLTSEDFTDKRKTLQKSSSRTIRLGLSKSSKTSFKPPRSTQHDNSPSLLSYFSYQQRDKLKH